MVAHLDEKEAQPILQVKDLVTSFQTETGKIRAVDHVSFTVRRGKTLAIVGESGCGKSVTALSIMRLLPEANSSIDDGSIYLASKDILQLKKSEMQKIRGNEISMVFQEPMTALNPVFTVGQQIIETIRIHRTCTRKKAREMALQMLKEVSIPDPERRIDEYPFQLSGGMRQRVMIAIALACRPQVLIADEPTTALDVTIQKQIMDLMKTLQTQHGTSIILITHDLGVVADAADDIVIMYAGNVIEKGSVLSIFERPAHPYTVGLLASVPKLDSPKGKELTCIEGMVPSLHHLPSGCRFHPRCPKATSLCQKTPPKLQQITDDHWVACHHTNARRDH